MKNWGLIEELGIDPRAYVNSAKVPCIPYQPDGDWTNFLPRYEAQADEWESNGCTSWGLHNQIETLYKRIYGEEPNYDEWFNFPLIPITKGGQDPHVTYESARQTGFVPAGTLSIPRNYEEASDKTRVTKSIEAKGQNWLVKHEFKHEWLWQGMYHPKWKDVLKEALMFSPIGVSVYAWHQGQDGRYIIPPMPKAQNNHWVILYKIDDQGFHIFDTYDHSKKILHPDHQILRAKRIHIVRRDKRGARKQISVLQKILNVLLMQKTLLDICKAHLGVDPSPLDEVDDDVACASTATKLLKKVYSNVPHITGTATLYEWLDEPQNGFKRVTDPEPEDIIISPTSYGNGSIPGHVGFIMENGLIASNDSRTGKFLMNFDLQTWRARYVDKGGFPVAFFRRVK